MSRARSVADLGNQNVLDLSASAGTLKVGAGATIENTGEAQFAGIITATGADFSGAVSVGGVLTYEDVTSVDSVGIITARSDLSIADKIIHTGDTNTSIRFPAADTVTVETGGSERLRVNSSGNVGIGTDNPSTGLHLLSADSYVTLQSSSASGNAGILFKDSGGTQNSVIFYDFDDDYLKFSVASDTEALRINSAGKVGIGTNNPIGNLQINADSEPTLYLYEGGTRKVGLQAQDGFGNILYSYDSEPLIFSLASGTSFSEKLRVTGIGSVGINDNNPTTILDVNGDIGIREGNNLVWHDTNGTAAFRIRAGSDNILHFERASGNEQNLTINDGKLLVGTTTSRIVEDHVGNGPQGKIQIEATNSDAILSIISAGTADVNRCGTISLGRHRNSSVGGTPTIVQDGDALGAIMFSAGDGTDMRTAGAKIHAEVDGTPGSNDMPGALIFSTTPDGSSTPGSSNERMKIHPDGVITMGSAHSVPSGASVAIRQAAPQLSLYATPGNVSRITMGDTDDHDIGQIGYDNSDNSMFFATGGSTQLRITNTGQLFLGTTNGYSVPVSFQGDAAATSTGTGSYVVMTVGDTNTGAQNVGGGIGFLGNDGVNSQVTLATIQGFKENGTSGNYAGAFGIKTRANGAALTEKLTILSSGDIRYKPNGDTSAANMLLTRNGDYIQIQAQKDGSDGAGFKFQTQDGGVLTEKFSIDKDGAVQINYGGSGYATLFRYGSNEDNYITQGASGTTVFRNHSNTEYGKLFSSGYLNFGGHLGSTNIHRFNGINATQGTHIMTVSGYQASGGSTQDTILFNAVNSSGTANASGSAAKVYRHDTTLRSFNCAGTVNTSGNDYAEYMIKAGDFTIAKGDICGVNAQGKLTNVFAGAVTFVVKSTDPSYVGGDTWDTAAGEEPGGYNDTRTGEELEAAKVAYQEQLEAVRQTVDRIAFSGQTPVNVTGPVTPGQHIIPTANSDGSISGTAKSEGDLTLAEYMSSVGKVIAIEEDGRARIIVKVA